MTHHAQILWFAGCPNTDTARTMLRDAVARLAPDTTVEDLDVTDASLPGNRIAAGTTPCTARGPGSASAPECCAPGAASTGTGAMDTSATATQRAT